VENNNNNNRVDIEIWCEWLSHSAAGEVDDFNVCWHKKITI
jgi:hypothetical protein